ncbi:MAG: hypothetical protein LBR06_06015 [Bacteroidales bacterium]|jgi:hypothetical protein|nr:hypothetical protein [Bacteroidales bacterium]
MVPKFLLADNSIDAPDMIYVVHTETPRFILGGHIETFDTEHEAVWFDPKPLSDSLIEDLLEEAVIFFNDALDHEDELDDEDE